MRKILLALPIAAAALAFATPSFAQDYGGYGPDGTYYPAGPAIAGAAVGTAVGVGLANGWYGSGVTATALGATTGIAIGTGVVAGIGTIALVDAVVQPCRGFHAMFNLNANSCVNGVYVGDQPPRGYHRRAMR